MKILIGGGRGFVGQYVTSYLRSKSYSVTWISREQGPHAVSWASPALVDAVSQSDVIINLSGENLFAQRWSAEFFKKLTVSRLETTQRLVSVLNEIKTKPRVYINASAIGFYGSEGFDSTYDENSPPGDDALARLCVSWENEVMKASQSLRTVILRIGVVLGQGGGALEEMVRPFKFFCGGHQGSGNQYLSWIHIHDLARMIDEVIHRDDCVGVFNAVGPQPEKNKIICQKIGKLMNRPCWLHPPAWLLREVLGDVAVLVVNGQRVYPRKFDELGFKFLYQCVGEALENLLCS